MLRRIRDETKKVIRYWTRIYICYHFLLRYNRFFRNSYQCKLDRNRYKSFLFFIIQNNVIKCSTNGKFSLKQKGQCSLTCCVTHFMVIERHCYYKFHLLMIQTEIVECRKTNGLTKGKKAAVLKWQAKNYRIKSTFYLRLNNKNH